MSKLRFLIPVLFLVSAVACKHKIPAPQPGTVINKKDSVCYQTEVQPILSSNCAMSGCHDATTKAERINLTSFAAVKQTITGSKLLKVVQATDEDRMPPEPRPALTSDQIAILKSWVNQGMKDGVDCQTCDSTSINFSANIFPIFKNSCVGCHTTQAPLLTNYGEIKAQMDNGKIPCTINWDAGCSKMPQGGQQLPLCQRRQIMKWLAAGAQNN